MVMKKSILSILLILLCVVLVACNTNDVDFQSVDIGVGKIAVPSSWTVDNSGDLLGFYDGDELCAFQSNSFSAPVGVSSNNLEGIFEINDYSDSFKNIYTISSNGLSNGAIYGEAVVSADLAEQIMQYVEFDDEENIVLLFFVPDMVSDDTIMQIAQSFS